MENDGGNWLHATGKLPKFLRRSRLASRLPSTQRSRYYFPLVIGRQVELEVKCVESCLNHLSSWLVRQELRRRRQHHPRSRSQRQAPCPARVKRRLQASSKRSLLSLRISATRGAMALLFLQLPMMFSDRKRLRSLPKGQIKV